MFSDLGNSVPPFYPPWATQLLLEHKYLRVSLQTLVSTASNPALLLSVFKVARPDSKPEMLGLTLLDEPCAKQSDPTVLDLQLRAFSKQTNLKQVVRDMLSIKYAAIH